MAKLVEWAKMTAPMLRDIASRDRSTALLPAGALEQHGPHLPTITDTISAEACARLGAELVVERMPVAVLPGLWLGLSEYHLPFGGTMSVDFECYRAMLRQIVRSLTVLGFSRLLVVNGHGGNVDPLAVLVRELAVEFDMPIVAMTPWFNIDVSDLTDPAAAPRHACDAETSLMLSLLPEAVYPENFERAAAPGNPRLPKKGYARFHSATDFAPVTGTWGDPRQATADKGEKFLERLGQAVADAIEDEDLWFRPDAVWKRGRGQGRVDAPEPA